MDPAGVEPAYRRPLARSSVSAVEPREFRSHRRSLLRPSFWRDGPSQRWDPPFDQSQPLCSSRNRPGVVPRSHVLRGVGWGDGTPSMGCAGTDGREGRRPRRRRPGRVPPGGRAAPYEGAPGSGGGGAVAAPAPSCVSGCPPPAASLHPRSLPGGYARRGVAWSCVRVRGVLRLAGRSGLLPARCVSGAGSASILRRRGGGRHLPSDIA